MMKIYKGTAFTALTLAVACACAQSGITVSVDGKPVNFVGTEPRMIGGRILVPLRGVFEQMGAYVQWDGQNREVIATRGNSDVRLRIGDKTARVDGRDVTMDVPATEINGATLVPIRFLSESLGARVRWRESDQMVMIMSDQGRAQRIGDQNYNPPRDGDPNRRPNRPDVRQTQEILARNTIIPVTLDDGLSSDGSRRGDTFTATVRTEGSDRYASLPAGTRIEGRVLAARPQHGDEPGLLELEFRQARLPDGSTYPIEGRLINLDNAGVVRDHGMLRATGKATEDNRNVYAGYGAGAGLVVGLLTKRPIEGTIAGGILGYLAGQQQHDQNRPRNVRLDPGTEFGVRLTQNLAIRQ